MILVTQRANYFNGLGHCNSCGSGGVRMAMHGLGDVSYQAGGQFTVNVKVRLPPNITTLRGRARPLTVLRCCLESEIQATIDGYFRTTARVQSADPISIAQVRDKMRYAYGGDAGNVASISVTPFYATPIGPTATPGASGGSGSPSSWSPENPVPDTTSAACASRGGTCVPTSKCVAYGGRSVSNLCPGLPADIKCCIPAGYDSPGSGGRSPGSTRSDSSRGGAAPTVTPGAGAGDVVTTGESGEGSIWPWAAGGAAVAALVVGGYWLLKRKKRGGRRR